MLSLDKENNGEKVRVMDERHSRKSKRRKKKKRGCLIFFILSIITLLGISFALIWSLFANNNFNLKPSENSKTYKVYLDNEKINLEYSPYINENKLMIDINFLIEYIDSGIYWDKTTDSIIITKNDKVLKVCNDFLTQYLSDEKEKVENSLLKSNGTIYISSDILEKIYNLKCAIEDEVLIVEGLEKNKNPENNENKNFEKITMVWDQILKPSQNERYKTYNSFEGLDVISPTWFAISNGEGEITSLADEGYVNWAHNKGYKVWALFSNSFDSEITHSSLESSDKREYIIKQIVEFVKEYNLDGINIDFENVSSEDGENYVQFIREITPYLHNMDIVVSVDVYVPRSWTSHYNIEELGKIVDYIVVMAYDEHWSTSPVSGSVASKNWVYLGIQSVLEMVDSKKVIMGIPFYTRLWKEEMINDELVVSSKAYGMDGGKKILDDNNAHVIWSEDEGQYYGEYTIDGIQYKMWLEDEKSLETRIEIANTMNIAGISGWRLGLESDNTWSIIFDKFN